MVKRSWLLIAALPLSISPSWGADFYYRQQEKGTVYVAEQKGKKMRSSPNYQILIFPAFGALPI